MSRRVDCHYRRSHALGTAFVAVPLTLFAFMVAGSDGVPKGDGAFVGSLYGAIMAALLAIGGWARTFEVDSFRQIVTVTTTWLGIRVSRREIPFADLAGIRFAYSRPVSTEADDNRLGRRQKHGSYAVSLLLDKDREQIHIETFSDREAALRLADSFARSIGKPLR